MYSTVLQRYADIYGVGFTTVKESHELSEAKSSRGGGNGKGGINKASCRSSQRFKSAGFPCARVTEYVSTPWQRPAAAGTERVESIRQAADFHNYLNQQGSPAPIEQNIL
jgi:hypothetical protein